MNCYGYNRTQLEVFNRVTTVYGEDNRVTTVYGEAFSLFSFFALSACVCRFEVTVTSVSLPPFVSHRCLFDTNQRLSLPPLGETKSKSRINAIMQTTALT